MSGATIYAVIDTESEGFVGKERESACAWCVASLLENDAWRAEGADKQIPNAAQCAAQFVNGAFGAYWAGLDRQNKAWKGAFTKFAVGYLARVRAAEGRPIFLTRDALGAGDENVFRWRFSGAVGAAFDAANPAHVGEVLRVFFGAEVVSCGIVLCAFDAAARTVAVLGAEYAVYRPSAEHYACAAARAVHGLDAAALTAGADIAELHARLAEIVETYPGVVFVAHYAAHDRGVLLRSVEDARDRCAGFSGGGDASGAATRTLLLLKRELALPARWMCTWERCVRHISGGGGRRLANYRLPTVYEEVAGEPLEAHHNARTDAFACAVILCRLLGCGDRDVKRWFCGAELEAPSINDA
jgi:hypothetical protein